jgi:tetratricopeptide (TPR) repeat protein
VSRFKNKGKILVHNKRLVVALLVIAAACLLNTDIFPGEISHSATYYNCKGIGFVRKGDFDNAIECFNKSIELDNQNPYPYLNLGIVYKRKKDYDNAIENLQKALELNPDLQEAYTNFIVIYQAKGDFEKANEYSRKALTLNKDNPQSIYNLGYTYFLEGDKDLALEQYNKLKDSGETELAAKLLEKINQE